MEYSRDIDLSNCYCGISFQRMKMRVLGQWIYHLNYIYIYIIKLIIEYAKALGNSFKLNIVYIIRLENI